MKKIFKIPSNNQCKDSGIVLVIVFLVWHLRTSNPELLYSAIIFLFICLFLPRLFSPFAFLWFELSKIFEFIFTPLLLSMLYFILVMPVGLIRRLLGKGALNAHQWKSSKNSVFLNRNHRYTTDDLKHPY